MKSEMIVVYLMVAALVIIPYIAIILFGSGKSKKILKSFKEEVKSKGFTISEKEAWNRHIIGLDRKQHRLVFVQYLEDERIKKTFIDMSQCIAVALIQKKNTLKLDGKHTEILDHIGLELMMKDRSTQVLYFYNTGIDISQNYEYEHAEKWRNILQTHIKEMPDSKFIAA